MSPLAGLPGTTRRPATTGAKMTEAPMVATQPPRTAPHEVAAGRIAKSEFAMTTSFDASERRAAPTVPDPGRHAHPGPDGPEGRLLGERCLRSGRAGQLGREVRALPGQVEVGPAEVTVGGGLPVDRAPQLEALDDRAGPEVEVLRDQAPDRLV